MLLSIKQQFKSKPVGLKSNIRLVIDEIGCPLSSMKRDPYKTRVLIWSRVF